MKKYTLLILAFVLFCSHDMYLKLDTYFLSPHSDAIIQLYNGTFDLSENVIDRNRMTDVSLVGNGQRVHPDTSQWSEKDSTTLLRMKTGDAGTWVAGVSTRPRLIAMAAEDFNRYLEHDGVLDMLSSRQENQLMDQDAVERYSKHVKAIFQVGNQFTDDWQTRLGYPIEFVPLQNPYHLHDQEPLQVQLFWQGEPLADQLVYVNHAASKHEHRSVANTVSTEEHDHGHEHAQEGEHTHEDGGTHTHDDKPGHEHSHEAAPKDNSADTHQHTEGLQLRTDADGIITFQPNEEGIWYLRTIYLTTSDEPELTHESNWATLTFELGNRHSHGTAAHEHSHEGDASAGIPSYVYWLGSLLLLVGLFFWFKQKSAA